MVSAKSPIAALQNDDVRSDSTGETEAIMPWHTPRMMTRLPIIAVVLFLLC